VRAARPELDRIHVGKLARGPGRPRRLDRGERAIVVERADVDDLEGEPGPLLDVARSRDLGDQPRRIVGEQLQPDRRERQLRRQPVGVGARLQARNER
jgi:hypothetical protein